MDWNENAIKEIEDQLGKNLEKAAIHLMNKIKVKVNRSQPYVIYKGETGRYYHGQDPSQPGESPKKVRGDFQRSITYEISSDKKSAKVGTNLDYGMYLELGTVQMQPRPFLRNTLNEEAGRIEDIMATPPK